MTHSDCVTGCLDAGRCLAPRRAAPLLAPRAALRLRRAAALLTLNRAAAFTATLCLAGGIMQVQPAHADAPASPFGLWKTIDDHTGKPRALVRIYQQDGELFGKIEHGFAPDAATKACDACKDERHGQPMTGLVIIRHLKADGDGWGGGDILDPDTGTVYRCKLHLENGGATLVVRGFIGFSLLGRSQIWLRQP